MADYPNEAICDLFVLFGKCNNIVLRTIREFNLKYPNLPPMTREKFSRIKNNFSVFGKIFKPIQRPREVTEDEGNQVTTLGYFRAFPRASIRAASSDLGLSYSTIQRILNRNHMHPYSFVRLQKLYPGDLDRRVHFCEDLLIKIQENNFFLRNIIWTDEAKFNQEGIFNRKNEHFWNNDNPHLISEINSQHQFSVNVFCLIIDNQVRYHIYEENLNSQKYLEILENVVEDFIDNLPLIIYENLWYQMDGAPAHSSISVDRKLTQMFGDRWWGNRGPLLWPPRSPDLTPLDFYLWGRIKTSVYNNGDIQNVDELKNKIRNAFNDINPNEVRKATNSVESRILLCLQENGQHIEHLK